MEWGVKEGMQTGCLPTAWQAACGLRIKTAGRCFYDRNGLRLENKQRALRAAFEPVRWVDENETYVEFEA